MTALFNASLYMTSVLLPGRGVKAFVAAERQMSSRRSRYDNDNDEGKRRLANLARTPMA